MCRSGEVSRANGGCEPGCKKLNANAVKLIAIIAMTADHIAWAVFPGFPTQALPMLIHIIGRITCPIMCYFVAEGYHYTRNINKYTARMFLFAFISHFPYVLTTMDFVDFKSFIPFYYGSFVNQTSVMWSLAWGLVMLRVANSTKIQAAWLRMTLIILICVISFPSDWSCIAALCILAMGTNRGSFKKQMLWLVFLVLVYSVVYFFVMDEVYCCVQMFVVLAIPLLWLYNGRLGKNKTVNKLAKWGFYIYYPAHLFVIGIVEYACR